MALTRKQAINWILNSVGKAYNPDGAYGYHCKDYADAYAIALFGNWVNTLRPNNAKDAFDGANPDFFHKIRKNSNSPNLIPEPGDIIVYNGWGANPYGHIAVVLDANIFGVMVVEQDGFLQIPARKIFYSYDKLPIIGWLRPKYQAEVAVPQDDSWRVVTSDIGVNVRNEPNTQSGIFAAYPKESNIQMKGYCKGENVNGSDIWFVSARSTKFLHSSAFSEGIKTLPHLPQYDKVQVAPAQKVEVQTPPVQPKVEYHSFEKQFDFVDEVHPVAVSNQFYGRKNLKGADGKYYADIPDDYASQKAFVDQLNKPTSKIQEITIHNTANTSVEATLNEFRRVNSHKSSHLVVSNTKIVQCVPKENTAFTNGSHESNIESFTIEFLDDVTDERYLEVLGKVSEVLGVKKIGKHRDHSATACPAKLSDEKIEEFRKKLFESTPKTPETPPVEKKVEEPVNKEEKNTVEQVKYNVLTEKEMAQIKEIEKQARAISNEVEYNPVIPENVKLKTYFTTGSLLIATTLVSSIAVALMPENAILILAIAGSLNTAYASINQLFKISSKK